METPDNNARAGSFAWLVIKQRNAVETTFHLDSGTTWRIGREEDSKIVLADEAVSRKHAVIQRSEWGEYYVLDLGSSNGTFVRDKRVKTPVKLHDGDVIAVGGHKLVFHYNPDAAPGDLTILSDDQMTRTRVVFSQGLISVLVVDLHGFTKLAQGIPQDVLCKFIHDWFTDATNIFRARGAWTLKYIGDAVMATWLHAEAQDKTPILTALTALNELARLTSPDRYGLAAPVRFGAGLNTGLASIGNAGSGDQTDFTALGDTVNAAFRIEAATRTVDTDFAIGSVCAQMLGEAKFAARHLTRHVLELKGYSEAMPVWGGSFTDLGALLLALGISSPTPPFPQIA